MKYSIGRPRPNFIELQKEKDVDSRLSFPSVHASVPFSLLFQLSLYLYTVHSHVTKKYNKINISNLNPWDCNNPYAYYFHWLFYKLRYVRVCRCLLDIHNLSIITLHTEYRTVPLISLLIVGIPTYFATYISCTRLVDYQHFYSDVLGGIFIGSFFAFACFHHYTVYLHLSLISNRARLCETGKNEESISSDSAPTKNIAIQMEHELNE